MARRSRQTDAGKDKPSLALWGHNGQTASKKICHAARGRAKHAMIKMLEAADLHHLAELFSVQLFPQTTLNE
jgi:hypothetical protein